MGASIYPQLRDALLAAGCVFVRQGKGSHEIWHSPITGSRFPVAANINSRNLANKILREAGVEQKI